MVILAAFVLAVGLVFASTPAVGGAGSLAAGSSCSPSDEQYGDCGQQLDCTVLLWWSQHLDIPDPTVWDEFGLVWEGDPITIRVSGCAGITLANVRVTWFRDGKKVGSQLPYVVGSADVGHHLSARIKVHADGIGTQIVEKQIASMVNYAPPRQLSAPSILGQENLHLGSTLTADPGTWQLSGTDPGPLHYTYCWTSSDANDWLPPIVSVEEWRACNVWWTIGTGQTLTLAEWGHGPPVVGQHVYLYVFASGAGAPQDITIYDTETVDTVAP